MVTQNSINTENPVVQLKSSSTGSLVTCTSHIPTDDTIPQNTEGTEVLTVTITPRSTTNLLYIYFNGLISNGVSSTICQIALFQDSTANALIAVRTCEELASNSSYSTMLQYVMPAGTTSSTTFKIRVGPEANTCYVNGDYAGTRVFGGTALSYLVIKELVS